METDESGCTVTRRQCLLVEKTVRPSAPIQKSANVPVRMAGVSERRTVADKHIGHGGDKQLEYCREGPKKRGTIVAKGHGDADLQRFVYLTRPPPRTCNLKFLNDATTRYSMKVSPSAPTRRAEVSESTRLPPTLVPAIEGV